MKLMVIAPAILPSAADVQRKMRFFLRSCTRWNIQPFMYGIGTKQFPGYQAMKIDVPLAFVERNRGDYTHVFYTDSWDAVFTGSLLEIKDKYERMGSPPYLVCAANFLGNVSDEQKQYPGVFKHDTTFCFPQVGGYIGEIPLVIETLSRMKRDYGKYNDDAFAWYDSIRDGWWKPVLDSNCEIFMVRAESYVEVVDGVRIRNTVTGSMPCVWHICGGFTSQETGTDERMTPIAEMLGLL